MTFKRYTVVALLAAHALVWAASAAQGVLLQSSPKGISPDAFLFGGVFTLLAASVLWLANRVRLADGRVTILIMVAFALLGALGILVGGVILIAARGATDAYVLPMGALALVVGLVHVAGAAAAFGLVREPSLHDSSDVDIVG